LWHMAMNKSRRGMSWRDLEREEKVEMYQVFLLSSYRPILPLLMTGSVQTRHENKTYSSWL
jgi:hypothetical protein